MAPGEVKHNVPSAVEGWAEGSEGGVELSIALPCHQHLFLLGHHTREMVT